MNDIKKAGNCTVIGIGDLNRKDDAAGRIAVRELKAKGIEGFHTAESGGDVSEIMYLWKDFDLVIILDAMKSSLKPGEIRRFDAVANPLPEEYFPNFSTHSFSLAQVIEIARELSELPLELIVYGIEGEDFSMGSGLSPAVAGSIEIVKQKIISELQLPITKGNTDQIL